jgi:manganese/zinc/iron transport system permease protein
MTGHEAVEQTRLWELLAVDLPPLLAALLSSIVCGLLGNWLVLRRMSLMGDAISHSVLPGIVAAFLITGSRAPLPMFVGALVAGGLTTLLSAAVRRYARVDSGAAMGVVFASLFALGILLIEQAAARQVDLDPDCVLYGSLETLFWFPPASVLELFSWSSIARLPTPILTLSGTTALAAIVTWLLRKELALTSFDPELGAALGFRPRVVHAILMMLVAAATVASFEAVGSILVVAMLTCPAACARLWTDRLRTQISLSLGISVLLAISGYAIAATAPTWLGTSDALNIAGTISVMGGVALVISVLASPQHGVLANAVRRRSLAQRIAREDVLGLLYRFRETGLTTVAVATVEHTSSEFEKGLRLALASGEVEREGEGIRLTESGLLMAQALIRRHRKWEGFLAEELGLAADHVHSTAEQLEHFAEAEPPATARVSDPHGKPIP